MIPVAALYRISTLKPKKDEHDTIPQQSALIRDFISRHEDWKLVEEYFEEGISAYKVSQDNRDILQRVLADALNGKFKKLLIFSADRLSRKSSEYQLVLRQLYKDGVEVITVADTPEA